METAVLKAEMDAAGESPTIEQLAEWRDRIDFLKEFAKATEARWDALMFARCETEGDQEIGDIRYYAGIDKKTTCPDIAKGLETILECAGGDFGMVAEMLASNPFKPGACRDLLGNRWGDVFTVVEKLDLKEGKPTRKLIEVNGRFVK
jgi:hypothetical protein